MKLIFVFVVLSLHAAVGSTSRVKITWSYENFPEKIELYSPTPGKEAYISETKVVSTLGEAPVVKNLGEEIIANHNSSTTAVLVIRNNQKNTLYFFAVPHELNPHHASAGHYFECLCIGRLFKISPGKIFYRIVRLNLNKSFKGLKTFTINHQIVGVSEAEANTTYKDRLRIDD